MTVETIGIVSANAIIVLTAVWRMSALLAQIQTQLAHVIKDHKEDTDAAIMRLNAHEARLLNLERRRRETGDR